MLQKVKDAPRNFDSEALRFLNLRLNHYLYAFDKSPALLNLYEQILRKSHGEEYSSDINLTRQLISGVALHMGKYGDRSLIVANGSANILWRSIKHFENNYNCFYVPAPPLTINSLPSDDPILSHKIAVQLRSCVDAVKRLGYEDIESFMYRKPRIREADGIRNIMVIEEKVDIPDLYDGNSGKDTYLVLEQFLKENKPRSLLYIQEGLDVDAIRKEYEAYKEEDIEAIATLTKTKHGKKHLTLPRDKLIMSACDEGIDVNFWSFGVVVSDT